MLGCGYSEFDSNDDRKPAEEYKLAIIRVDRDDGSFTKVDIEIDGSVWTHLPAGDD